MARPITQSGLWHVSNVYSLTPVHSAGIITMFRAVHERSESARDYSPTCCTRRETQKRLFTWATWCVSSPLTLSQCVTTLFRIDTAGHRSLRIIIHAGCVTRTQTICRSRLFLLLLPTSVYLPPLCQRSARSVGRIKKCRQ